MTSTVKFNQLKKQLSSKINGRELSNVLTIMIQTCKEVARNWGFDVTVRNLADVGVSEAETGDASVRVAPPQCHATQLASVWKLLFSFST